MTCYSVDKVLYMPDIRENAPRTDPDRRPFRCPICQTPVPEPTAGQKSFFPFCSDRCKLIDLGRWLDGKYQIPVSQEEAEDLPLDDT